MGLHLKITPVLLILSFGVILIELSPKVFE